MIMSLWNCENVDFVIDIEDDDDFYFDILYNCELLVVDQGLFFGLMKSS